MRDTSRRRQEIIGMLHDQGSVQVIALSEQFQVSTQTIRKDLAFLEERGVSVRCYGGAVAAGVIGVVDEDPVDAKRGLHMPEKERIGRLAASMVRPGDAIILDSGTTTAQIARFLPEKGDIVVLTNDAGILNQLMRRDNIEIVLLGGRLRRKNMAFYGGQTEAADHLNHDHGYVKQYLYDLENMPKDSPAFLAKVAEFRGAIEEHAGEEENTIFPALKARLSEEENKHLTFAMNREGFKLA